MRFLLLLLLLAACKIAPTSTVGVITELQGMQLRGTGSVIHTDASGTYILTAGHLIGPHGDIPRWRAAEYHVELWGSVPRAKYIAHQSTALPEGYCDLGVLRIDPTDAPELSISESGDLVGKLQVKTYRGGSEYILDAELDGGRLATEPTDIQPGDSGSALLANGELVGVVVGIPEQDDEAVWIRHKAILAFLKRNNLEWLIR